MLKRDDTINTLIIEDYPNDVYDYKKNTELLQKIMNATPKERKFLIFKLFYDRPNIETIELIDKEIFKHPIIYYNIAEVMAKAMDARQTKNIFLDNRELLNDIMLKYQKILEQISCLSKEVCVENSLDLSILFSYLLWGGYLSKDKEYYFDSANRKGIMGLYFMDIMDGTGVCLNHSEMLKDLLIANGYSSAMIMNYYYNNNKSKKILNIERKFHDKQEEDKTLYHNRTKKRANHVFNLIEENKKLYIYDATNLSIHSIKNSQSSSIINGKGKTMLFPYSSYGFALTENECHLLDRLFTEKESKPPYDQEDFESLSQVNLEILNESRQLLEDFYTEIRPYIMGISEEANKILKKAK